MLVESIVGMVVGGVLLAGIFYALAPAFTRRGAVGADIDGRIDKLKVYIDNKITNDIPHMVEEIKDGFMDELKEGLPVIMEMGAKTIQAAMNESLGTIGASILGKRGAEKKATGMQQTGLAGIVGQMAQAKGIDPAMAEAVPGIIDSLPPDIKKLAAKNPQMAMMVIDKILGGMGKGGGNFGSSGGNISY